MLSIKEEIEKNIKLYLSLKRIFYIKIKDIDAEGNVTVKDDYVRASQKFNIKKDGTDKYDDEAADNLLESTKLQISNELLSITTVILEFYEKYNDEKIHIESLKNENDHLKVFKYCFKKLVETMVISPHDTIEYEPLYDKEGDMIGCKLMTDADKKDDL